MPVYLRHPHRPMSDNHWSTPTTYPQCGGPGVVDGRESLSTGLPVIHQQLAGIARYESTFSTDCACSHHVSIHRICSYSIQRDGLCRGLTHVPPWRRA